MWIAGLADSSIVKIPRDNSNDTCPMWVGDQVYFLSDRAGAVTLFCYDTAAKSVAQVLKNDGLDFKTAASGPGAIAYEQFGGIHLYDLKSKKSTPVNITVAADLPEVRPHFGQVGEHISAASISPTGVRVAFETHGEILTVPAEKGDVRNLTNTSGAMERSPVWAPDGKGIAYFSDESGEYMIHIREQNGMGDARKILGGDGSAFFYSAAWSPDSKKLVYTDDKLNAWWLDVESGKSVKVDTDTYYASFRTLDPSWSPDSRWIAYTH